MKNVLVATFTAVALAFFVPMAHAANIWREAGCNGGDEACYTIHIDGKIEPNDWILFKRVVDTGNISKAFVTLNSPGGAMLSGLRIGATIHDLGFSTFVDEKAKCASRCGNVPSDVEIEGAALLTLSR
jgi:hypothetical protein